MDAFLLTVFALTALAALRNWLAFRWGVRMLEETYSRNIDAIERGLIPDFAAYDRIPSHEALMFDLRVWTLRAAIAKASA